MEIKWNEWVIGYDFAHQMALAQNLQRSSKNWGESARAWFDRKQQDSMRRLKSWQLQHGSLGYLLPVMLLLLLAAQRQSLTPHVSRLILAKKHSRRTTSAGKSHHHRSHDDTTPSIA